MASINDDDNTPICSYITILINNVRYDEIEGTCIREIVKRKCIVSMSLRQYNYIFDEIGREDFHNISIYSPEMKDCPFQQMVELENEGDNNEVDLSYSLIKIQKLDHYKN